MQRRAFLRQALGAGVSMSLLPRASARPGAGARRAYSARTLELVRHTPVVDMLSLLTLDWPRFEGWRRDPDTLTVADIQRLRSSGITVFHPAVGLPSDTPFEDTRSWLEDWNRFLVRHANHFERIDDAASLRRVKATGKIGVLLGMQNSSHFRTVADVDLFYGLGQRVSQLTYNAQNAIGGGCKSLDEGLTPFGAAVVRRMEERGMVVDLSHCGDRTTLDTIAAARKPVLITHANCRSLVPEQPRCKSDEVIKALARQGGVMGITCLRPFVSGHERGTIEHLLDHFDHVARLVGVEHVGLGSDTDLEQGTLDGLGPATRVYDLVEGLTRRGYTDAHIRLVLGGNFARVLGQVLEGPRPAVVATPA